MLKAMHKVFNEVSKTKLSDLPKLGKFKAGMDKAKEVPFYRKIKELRGLASEKINEGVRSFLDRPYDYVKHVPPIYRAIKEMREIRYSSNIMRFIRSPEELRIYRRLGLRERIIDGRHVLVRNDIDPNFKGGGKLTNYQRMKEGRAPLGKDGRKIELHHIGQKHESPLAELTQSEHNRYDKYLHVRGRGSEVSRSVFDTERENYWKQRAMDFEKGVSNG